MQRFGWAPVMEGEYIIGLSGKDGAISLEPGGQFELSGAPLKTVHETCNEVNTHQEQVRAIANEIGAGVIGLGYAPSWRLDEVPMMPKGRYEIMRNYMPKVGGYGREMMFRTCTVQVNLDFSSEADMVKKFRVGLALQPIATALFANSPFREGKPNGFLSYRSQIWTDVDNDRAGMLPFAFEEGMGFERYVDYALDVPMYFLYRDGRYIDTAGKSFRGFLDGKVPELRNFTPTMDDWADHLTTIFPEVRLKTFLEMRGADSGSWRRICGIARVVGRHLLRSGFARCGMGSGEGLDGGGTAGPARFRTDPGLSHAVPQTAMRATLRARCWRFPPLVCAAAPTRTLPGCRKRASWCRSESWPSAATPARKNCWGNSAASGTAISRACSRNTISSDYTRR